MVQIRARRCIVPGGEEVDLLASRFGKCSEMYKVSLLPDAIESYNGSLRWSLTISDSVLSGIRIKSSDVVLC